MQKARVLILIFVATILVSSVAAGVSDGVAEAGALPVNPSPSTSPAAAFTYPTNGQVGVDTTKAFTWSTVPASQGSILVVGTKPFGTDLVNSGILPAAQAAFPVPALPVGKRLYATLLTKVAGAWSGYNAVSFTVAPGLDAFIYPVNGQANVDTNQPFTWTSIAASQGSILVIGTTKFGTNLVDSGLLPASQGSYGVPVLPRRETLYATLLTETNGTFTRFQALAFTSAGGVPHGSLDTSFGSNGQVTLEAGNSGAGSLSYLAGTGQTLAAFIEPTGMNGVDSFVRRLSASGVHDASFGNQGTVALPAGMAVGQVVDGGGGKVLAVGRPAPVGGAPAQGSELVRLTAAGALDTGFGTGGVVTLAAGAPYASAPQVAVGPDGRIFVAMEVATGATGATTSKLGIAAFNADGTPDTTFFTAGMTSTTVGGSVGGQFGLAVQPNGDLVVSAGVQLQGSTATEALVARFLPHGHPDPTFGTGGVFLATLAGGSDYTQRVALAAGGQIVIAGTVFTPSGQAGLLAALTPSGALDTAFGTGGTVIEHPQGDIDDFQGLAVGADGSIYALMIQQDGPMVGSLYRFLASGAPDTTFGTGGAVTLDNTVPGDVAIGYRGRPEISLTEPPTGDSFVDRFNS